MDHKKGSWAELVSGSNGDGTDINSIKIIINEMIDESVDIINSFMKNRGIKNEEKTALLKRELNSYWNKVEMVINIYNCGKKAAGEEYEIQLKEALAGLPEKLGIEIDKKRELDAKNIAKIVVKELKKEEISNKSSEAAGDDKSNSLPAGVDHEKVLVYKKVVLHHLFDLAMQDELTATFSYDELFSNFRGIEESCNDSKPIRLLWIGEKTELAVLIMVMKKYKIIGPRCGIGMVFTFPDGSNSKDLPQLYQKYKKRCKGSMPLYDKWEIRVRAKLKKSIID